MMKDDYVIIFFVKYTVKMILYFSLKSYLHFFWRLKKAMNILFGPANEELTKN